jgi:hypothetical protein
MTNHLTHGRIVANGVVTPQGRLIYPSFFEPRLFQGEKDQTKGKYQTLLLLPKIADISILRGHVEFAKLAKWPTAHAGIASPIKKTAETKHAEYADEYPWLISASSYGYSQTGKPNRPPQVVFKNNAPCGDETKVYGGRWAVLAIWAKTYDLPSKGMNFGLNMVQLRDDDDPIGPGRLRPEDAFEAVGDDADSAAALFG